nr:immunoglobulin light chain junction region [Macaca mulatta]MOY04859.1 immunoglobulin light chain junction region [Macaca mulatta]MOY04861.1 immunoglobulin light chain junction region [Macaca mulatta]MOY04869.1 immunoglobulin light chain junction region [Macaca mulatta]MOY04881.1 immunoglobulin light chain junction region [Macaca mulatta]
DYYCMIWHNNGWLF